MPIPELTANDLESNLKALRDSLQKNHFLLNEKEKTDLIMTLQQLRTMYEKRPGFRIYIDQCLNTIGGLQNA
jgi:hypothetical protein